MTMIENLTRLFRVDSQVRGLRSRLQQAERYLAAQQRKVDDLEVEKRELEARRKQHQAKVKSLETEVASLNERIEKLRGEMNQSETSKQYTALLNETNAQKAAVNELETLVLLEMEQVEAAAAGLITVDEQIADRLKHRDIAQRELEQRTADVGERLAELEAERAVAAADVPEKAIAIFNELADTYEGEALAVIEVIDKRNREYACSACNMHVPFESVSRLIGLGDEMVRCTVCRRILYMQDEMKGALASGKK